jgi:GMP synthase (glutamine-hydrolysing)
MKFDKILILDFGSQYTQLIARRIREMNVYSEIFPATVEFEKIVNFEPKGIILSGGPFSVYDNDSPACDDKIFEMNIPILGICYGLQYISYKMKALVKPAEDREYGRANLEIVDNNSELFEGIQRVSQVWMSHGDHVENFPEGFILTGVSENSPVCAVENPVKKIYGVQFHPEVEHTKEGKKILYNFVVKICGCEQTWRSENFIEKAIEEIKNIVGEEKVICAMSGGVDSAVLAVLLKKAIGDKLICFHVDNGLMRLNESLNVVNLFNSKFDLNVKLIDASEIFLEKLKNVEDPEKKRKIIGNTFIEVFEKEARNYGRIKFLAQGTLYPDVIESVSVKGKSATIKTHHNVGGLPEKLNFKLIEPFRELFKDEVREIGRVLGIPEDFIRRHPFPGPGLAVRILGEVTKERIKILQQADDIYISLLKKYNLYDSIWQAFAVLLPVKAVGVMGDNRTYENVIALRAVKSSDGMTAEPFDFDMQILFKIASEIVNKTKGVNRVVYDISAKPPATIEWE